MGFESTTTELGSDALTDWAIGSCMIAQSYIFTIYIYRERIYIYIVWFIGKNYIHSQTQWHTDTSKWHPNDISISAVENDPVSANKLKWMSIEMENVF